MKDLNRAAEIVRSVVDRVQVPVTVKMRKGWDENSVNAVELAQAVVDAGASAITVHGRTRSQFYSGKADWGVIAEVKKAVKVPVVGNGDIWSPIDALAMMEETGCDAIMIGRAALGNPWIFSRTVHFLKYGELLSEPKPEEKVAMALRHLDLLVQFKGERVAVWEMR
jgi:nifR3 family TIM-barrel protein